MADPSGRVRPNNEFRERLMEKVHVNVTETGKLAQQLLKSSRSHEVNSADKLCSVHFDQAPSLQFIRLELHACDACYLL